MNSNIDPSNFLNKHSCLCYNCFLMIISLQVISSALCFHPFPYPFTPFPFLKSPSISGSWTFWGFRSFWEFYVHNCWRLIASWKSTNLRTLPKFSLSRIMADQSILIFKSSFLVPLPLFASCLFTSWAELSIETSQSSRADGWFPCTDVADCSLLCIVSSPSHFSLFPGPSVLKWKRKSPLWFRTLSTSVLNRPNTFSKF